MINSKRKHCPKCGAFLTIENGCELCNKCNYLKPFYDPFEDQDEARIRFEKDCREPFEN